MDYMSFWWNLSGDVQKIWQCTFLNGPRSIPCFFLSFRNIKKSEKDIPVPPLVKSAALWGILLDTTQPILSIAATVCTIWFCCFRERCHYAFKASLPFTIMLHTLILRHSILKDLDSLSDLSMFFSFLLFLSSNFFLMAWWTYDFQFLRHKVSANCTVKSTAWFFFFGKERLSEYDSMKGSYDP